MPKEFVSERDLDLRACDLRFLRGDGMSRRVYSPERLSASPWPRFGGAQGPNQVIVRPSTHDIMNYIIPNW